MTDELKIRADNPLVNREGLIERTWFRFLTAVAAVTNSALTGVGQQATVGAAGAASALPVTPTGYQTLTINGVDYVVPYYDKV